MARPRYPRISGSTAAKAQSRAAFVATGGVSLIPAKALTFSNGEPLQFSDGSYLEFSA